MLIDIIYILLLLHAVWQGYRKGLIVAVFSVVSLIVGLAAATKLSATVAVWLRDSTNFGAQWIPFISFILVMIATVILIRRLAKLIQEAVQMLMMGWINRLSGILLYMIIYTVLLSIVLFYFTHLAIIKDEILKTAVSYPFIQPWGAKAIDGIGAIIPAFKNVFAELQTFFESFSKKS